jgi:hypothetical protein
MKGSLLTIEIEEDPESFLEWVGREIKHRDGTIVGDVSRGEFSLILSMGRVRGEYWLLEKQLTIMVTRKPLLISGDNLRDQFMHFLRRRDV